MPVDVPWSDEVGIDVPEYSFECGRCRSLYVLEYAGECPIFELAVVQREYKIGAPSLKVVAPSTGDSPGIEQMPETIRQYAEALDALASLRAVVEDAAADILRVMTARDADMYFKATGVSSSRATVARQAAAARERVASDLIEF